MINVEMTQNEKKMSIKQETIPVGYKKTDVGIIPEDWMVMNIAKTMRLVNGYGFKPSQWKKEGLPIIRIQNLNDPHASCNYFPGNVDAKFHIKKGDLLFAWSGSKGVSFGARVWQGQKAILNQHIFKVIPDENIVTAEFSYLVLCKVQEQVEKMAHGFKSSFVHVKKGDLENTPLPIPPKEEQQSIANVLTNTDELITALEQLISKKKAIKTATMQQLLTGRTRLPQFAKRPNGALKGCKSSEIGMIPEDWETVAMGDMGTTYGGLSGKSKNDFGSGNSLYIPFTNIMANVIINVNLLDRVKVHEIQNSVLPGDLLFNGSSETPEEVCFCSLLSDEIDKLYLNSFCFGFRSNSQPKYLPLYLAYWFRSNAGRTAVSMMAQGSTRYNISKSQFLTLKIVIPSIQEQTAIATILSDMDIELEALEKKLAKLRDIKQGMMEQLLTGRIRLSLVQQP
ncbi:restriction endonuclease subunit S [Klebsiella oxytoca]|nr:restriction endonuclease subunit S [Klebsiella oxytoca]HCB1755087.1 restriction endonuclease subunit S [Klebsiella oxytoca]HCB1761380.1 restriction endonuclease subunit S [Klebsiella oxytoca]HCB1842490.1 restriction endonuclease subunit S [Klebsiella oxytoca]HCB1897177.1 restriction endonuclease subunit S [Klebsiella oxytoca]